MAEFFSLSVSPDDRVALIDAAGQPLTFGHLRTRADDWAARLVALAGGRRPLVGLDFATSTDAIAAYLGILRAGFPVLVVEPGQLAPGTRMAAIWQPDLHIAAGPDGALDVIARPADRPGEDLRHPDPHHDLALLLSTSGTTGDPKLVRLSRGNICANASAIAEYLAITPADRAMVTLPLFYSYGLSVLNSYLAAGASLILTDRSVVDPRFWDDFRRHGATSMALVPHQFNLLAGSGFTGLDLPGLRYITQAGGKLDAASVRRFHAMARAGGWELVLMYGQTEAAPRISYVPPSALPEAADTIGIPVPGGRIRLLDDAGDEITVPGRPGELVYAGPNVMMGYGERRPDLARGAEVTELRTGDVAERTPEGFFRIVGRMKRFVKIAGLRLSLDRIEALLLDRGLPAQAVAVEDRLVLLHSEAGAGDGVRATVADAFGLPLSELHADHLAEMPLLASGKPDHKALGRIAAEVLQGADARPADTGQSLAEVLRIATRASAVGPGDSFNSLGGDSLSYLQMQMALEERLGEAPPGWETMPLSRLEGLAAPAEGQPTRSPVGIDVILRVAAISVVVVQHATDLPLNGGVWVLIALMGYSAARFQMQSIAEGRALRLGVRMLYPILPFYLLLLIAYEVLRGEVPFTYYWMLGEYEIIKGSLLSGFWFVSFYVKAVLILMLFAAVPPARRLLTGAPWLVPAFALIALLIGEAMLLVQGNYVIDQTSSWPRLHYTTHGFIECLPFFLTGWMIHRMRGRWQEAATLALAVVMLAIFAQFQLREATILFLSVSLGLLALNPTVRLPVALARLVQNLASVTLFVYLVHQIVITPLYDLALPEWVAALLALVASFSAAWVCKVIFDQFDRRLTDLLNRARPSARLDETAAVPGDFGKGRP